MRTLLIQLTAALALAATLPAVAAPSDQEVSSINAARAEYLRARKAIDQMDWRTAIDALQHAARLDPNDAEFQNLLGFSYRNLGDMDAAFRHYFRALELNPRHRGAHEYLGRAYLMVDKPEKALEHLQILERDCPETCRERE